MVCVVCKMCFHKFLTPSLAVFDVGFQLWMKVLAQPNWNEKLCPPPGAPPGPPNEKPCCRGHPPPPPPKNAWNIWFGSISPWNPWPPPSRSSKSCPLSYLDLFLVSESTS